MGKFYFFFFFFVKCGRFEDVSRILVTHKLPFWDEVGKPLLDAGHEVVLGKLSDLDESFDAVLSLLTDKVNKEILDKGKKLKIVANYAVGFDNIDIAECKARNILATNTPSEKVNESVAEFAWTLMLALTRRLPEASAFMHNAAYRGWEPEIFLGEDLASKTLGIIGMGRIGSMVAKRAEGFNMKVVSFSRSSGNTLESVLKESDFVSLHVPLSEETRHLINQKTLEMMKPTAFLINTARGPVVDEQAVASALRAGKLAGYGADVLEFEPNPYPELLQLENALLTPHVASATKSARIDMGNIVVANLLSALSGNTPANLVK